MKYRLQLGLSTEPLRTPPRHAIRLGDSSAPCATFRGSRNRNAAYNPSDDAAEVLIWHGKPFDLGDIDERYVRMALTTIANRRRGPRDGGGVGGCCHGVSD